MRPTDENQPGSKRPNLMSSSRRANGEINILAMLDGRAGGRLSKRVPILPAVLWYAGAAILACTLVGALAWLARGSDDADQRTTDDTTLAATRSASGLPATEAAATEPPATEAAAAAEAERVAAEEVAAALATAGRAAIVDLPAAPVVTATTASAPAPTCQPDTRAVPTVDAATNPVTRARAPAAPPYRLATTAAHAAAAARPARRPAPASGKAAPAVDTDVALISAIIRHTNRNGDDDTADGAGTGASCAGTSCGPRMPDRP